MKKSIKKLIAPIIITALVIAVFIVYIVVILSIGAKMPWYLKAGITFGYIALSAIAIGVLISRIKEIKRGDEDDISKY